MNEQNDWYVDDEHGHLVVRSHKTGLVADIGPLAQAVNAKLIVQAPAWKALAQAVFEENDLTADSHYGDVFCVLCGKLEEPTPEYLAWLRLTDFDVGHLRPSPTHRIEHTPDCLRTRYEQLKGDSH